MRPLLRCPSAPVYVAEYSISAAAIAIFSLIFIILGTICVLLSFTKKRDYLLRPASMFYAFAGRVGALAREPGLSGTMSQDQGCCRPILPPTLRCESGEVPGLHA